MKVNSERKNGAILSYVSLIINTIVQLLYTPLLIRMLGQSEYGLYSLIASVIGYLTILDLGFGNAIVVYTAKYREQGKYEEEKKLLGMFKVIFYILGVVVAALGIVLFFNVENLFGDTMNSSEISKAKVMSLILTANLAITFLFNIYSSVISAYEKFTYQKITAIISAIMKPLIMIPLLFLGYKSITMVIVITIVNVAVLLSNWLYCKLKLNVKIKYCGIDKVLFKTILFYSFFIFLNEVVNKINWSLDQLILGAVSGTIAVSLYSVASQLNQVFLNLSTAMSGVLLPKVSKMVAKDSSMDELTDEMIKVGRLQYYIIFLAASGFVLLGKAFLNLWVGEGFEESYYVALLLILPVCIPLIQNLGLSILQALNKYKFRAIMTVCVALINAVISVILAKKYGAIGCAVGTAISLILCNVIISNIYYKRIGLDVLKFWKNIIKMSAYFCISIVVIIVLMAIIKLNGIIGFVVYGCLYVGIFSIIAYFFVMNKYEKDIVRKFLKALRIIK